MLFALAWLVCVCVILGQLLQQYLVSAFVTVCTARQQDAVH